MLPQYPTGTAKLMWLFIVLTLARTIWLPDDGPRTETCRSVFNVLMCKFYICTVVCVIIEWLDNMHGVTTKLVSRSFLMSNISTDNTTPCRGQHFACELRVERTCYTRSCQAETCIAVVLKISRAYPKGSATGSQRIRVYISVIVALKRTYFLLRV